MNEKKLLMVALAMIVTILLGGGTYYMLEAKETVPPPKILTMQVVVAKHDLHEGHKITAADIATKRVPKELLGYRPLNKKQVLEHYVTIPILKDETFREEKLANHAPEEKTKVVKHMRSSKSVYNFKMNGFKNPNFALQKKDKLDIIGVWGESGNPNVELIGSKISVIGFLERGEFFNDASGVVETKVPDKKTGKESVTKRRYFASEILLDMNNREIISVIEAYNKGNQLWMVLSNKNKNNEMVKELKRVFKVKKSDKPALPAYKANKQKLNSVISYGANEATKTFSENIYSNGASLCFKKIRVTARYGANVRRGPSTGAPIVAYATANTETGYTELVDGWYQTCEGYYIHASIAQEVQK